MRGDKRPSPVNLKNMDHNFLLEILIAGTNLNVSLPEQCWIGFAGRGGGEFQANSQTKK